MRLVLCGVHKASTGVISCPMAVRIVPLYAPAKSLRKRFVPANQVVVGIRLCVLIPVRVERQEVSGAAVVALRGLRAVARVVGAAGEVDLRGAVLQGGDVARRARQLPEAELQPSPVAVRVDRAPAVVHRAAGVLQRERLLEEVERRLGRGRAERSREQ